MMLSQLIKYSLLLLVLAMTVDSYGESNAPIETPFRPIPLESNLSPAEVGLGDKLFHDPILSQDGTISCAHCHSLESGGVDQLRFSVGIGGAEGDINTPTVFNSSFNFKQFWDGRAASLEEQVGGPITNPKEMGSSWVRVLKRLRADDEYVKQFKEVYKDGITRNNVQKAIATFERSLTTPNSKFDRYLRGETALTKKEMRGMKLFISNGCVSCHQGVGLGGNMFQEFGIMDNYYKNIKNIRKADLGRFNVTGKVEDKHVFKVPTLRNIEVTPPYFHDGSAETLEEAVRVMAHYQLGIKLSKKDVDAIVAFLKTLTGYYKGEKLK